MEEVLYSPEIDKQRSNLVLLFGSRPKKGVLVNTKMIDEVASILHSRYEKENLSIDIPAAFEQLLGEDAEFEMVLSNEIKHLRLFYHDNFVTHAKAVIFVNSGIDRKLADIPDSTIE